MPIPRAELIDADKAGLYHCVSRCVRRAFLCGGPDGRFEHRRLWLEERLRELSGVFAIDVVAYAVMSNHLHVLLWTDPRRVDGWSAEEVAKRWLALFPGPQRDGRDPRKAVATLARDRARIREIRFRLASISWFNRCLKEPLSRQANAEDNCSGAFWEGRFKSYRVADEAGAITCAVYIDLNAIRARIAATPEASHFTSIRHRIQIRQRSMRQRRRKKKSRRRKRLLHPEAGLWLTPLSREGARLTGRRSLSDIGIDAYLRLVDVVGRRLRAGKRGAIPRDLKSIIDRLSDDSDGWMAALGRSADQLKGTTIAHVEVLAAEAVRRGRSWVVDPLRPVE